MGAHVDAKRLFQELDASSSGEIRVADVLGEEEFHPPVAHWWRLLVLDTWGSKERIVLGAPLRLYCAVEETKAAVHHEETKPSVAIINKKTGTNQYVHSMKTSGH